MSLANPIPVICETVQAAASAMQVVFETSNCSWHWSYASTVARCSCFQRNHSCSFRQEICAASNTLWTSLRRSKVQHAPAHFLFSAEACICRSLMWHSSVGNFCFLILYRRVSIIAACISWSQLILMQWSLQHGFQYHPLALLPSHW